MTRRIPLVAVVLLFIAAIASADWRTVGPGVDYQEFKEDQLDIHVTRVDLTNEKISVISTRESEKGTRVSDFGKKYKALAAVNGDYFDDRFNPIGTSLGPCGSWDGALHSKREAMLAVSSERAAIRRQGDVDPKAPPPDWAATAVSGWPALVVGCEAIPSAKLPGSDAFTRSPHPRTAVGLSRDGKTLYLVVADGRRKGVPGVTLAQLGAFMADELDVCSAMNFDGGGSSAMWVKDKVVSHPADGFERPVGNHVGIVLRENVVACDHDEEAHRILANRERESKKQEPSSSTTAPPRQ